MGESGSGKTTLARVLLGLTEPDTGSRLELDGSRSAPRIGSRSTEQVRAIQIVFQNPDAALNRRFSVRRIIGRAITKLVGARGDRCDERARELARSVRFDERLLSARPAQLSGGLKQRVAIARAFAGDPRVVVCDEPTSALDVSVQAAILNLLADLQEGEDVSYVFISHDLAVVRYMSDRIAVLYLGRLMELGDAEQVFSPPHHPYTEALLSAVPTLDDVEPHAHPARGRDPERGRPALGLRLPHPLPTEDRRDLRGAGAAARRGRARPPHALPLHARRARGAAAHAAARAGGGRAVKVRAAVLPETGARLEIAELDLAAPGPGEVLVRLHASGVCHSDLNAIDGTAETPCPAVLGHEGAGVVEAVGAGVSIRPGRRVVPLLDARLRRLRGVPARVPAPLRRGVGRHGARRAPRRHEPPLARRRAGLPLLPSPPSPNAPSSPRRAASRCPTTSRSRSAPSSDARWRPASAPSGTPPPCGRVTGSR